MPDGRTLCVRLEERAGREAEAVLRFDAEPEQARKAETFFDDEPGGAALNVEGGCVRVPMKPFELVTVRVKLQGPGS